MPRPEVKMMRLLDDKGRTFAFMAVESRMVCVIGCKDLIPFDALFPPPKPPTPPKLSKPCYLDFPKTDPSGNCSSCTRASWQVHETRMETDQGLKWLQKCSGCDTIMRPFYD